MTLVNKYLGKVAYLIFLLLLDMTFLIIRMLSVFFFNKPSKHPKGDIILYPYAFIGSDGYTRRFVEYFPFLDNENIKYKVCNLFTDAYARKQLKRNPPLRYFFYLRILWKRIPQVLAARKYKSVFIQRGLFPLYFDLEIPHLERMLRKINKHITIDIWDSIFERQPVLVNETINYSDQLSLSNEFLMNHFIDFQGRRILWKIAVNLSKYKVKKDYSIKGKARLFWTGLPHNLSFLERYLPILTEISKKYPITLVLVCQQTLNNEELEIEHHPWHPDTFFDLLYSSDIGIYPEFNSVVSKGKSTMKVMDYLSTALPMIGVPYGLPSEAANGRELLIAESFSEWKQRLIELMTNQDLRKMLGENGRAMIEEHYSIEKSYCAFKKFAIQPKS